VVGPGPGFTLPLSGEAEAHTTARTLTASPSSAFVARPRRANQPFGARDRHKLPVWLARVAILSSLNR
jgi:hypothetical protein